MSGNLRDLIIFTDSYPFGTADSFIECEIPFLKAEFNTIFFVPRNPIGIEKPLPKGCQLVTIPFHFTPNRKLRYYIFRRLPAILKSLMICFLYSKNKLYYLSNFRRSVVDSTVFLEEADLYYDTLKDISERCDVFYFYWFLEPFIQISYLKRNGRINQRLISRGLGYDYDPAQSKRGFFPFREFEMLQIDKLIINSRWGANLVKGLYPKFSEKVEVSYLGLPYVSEINPPNPSNFHLVSCSYVVKDKRVDLIIEILKEIDFPVTWTHLGTGPLLADVKEKAKSLPKNVIAEFPGFIPSVLEYYKTVPVDLFITTTWIESLPFSVTEAIAFGIPVCGPEVCGIPEVITEESGFLFPRDFKPKSVANQILQFRNMNLEDKHALRRSARALYEKRFYVDNNAKDFIKRFLQ